MHLENWIYRVLCRKAQKCGLGGFSHEQLLIDACTGKMSKQQVQFALAETVPQGLRNRDSEMGQRSVDVPMSGAWLSDCV